MPRFEKEAILLPAFFNSKGELRPDAVLSLFQEMAIDHVNQYRLGRDDLLEQGLAWVVIQTRFVYCGLPEPKTPVRLATWSLLPRHAMVQREYEIADRTGRPLVLGTSQWVLIDLETRKPTLRINEILKVFKHGTTPNFDKRSKMLRSFERRGEGTLIIPEAADIDGNNHVNNVRYAAFMVQMMPEDLPMLDQFCIDYRKEMRLGEAFRLYTRREDHRFLIEGATEADDELVFIGEAHFAGQTHSESALQS